MSSPTTSIAEKGGYPEQEDHASLGTKKIATPGLDLIHIDRVAERKLVRKFDLRLIPIIFLLYLLCFIDRANIGNARIAGLEKDLGLTGYQYNIALSVFYAFYALVEIPANLVAKRVGPHIWIPSLVVAFGLVSMLTAWVENFAGLLAARIALGVAEGGVMPAMTFYLSRFYTRQELVFRIGIFVSASSLAGAFGGLLASGLLSVGSVGSVHSWRVVFLVEGLISMVIGIISFPLMSADAESAGWLNEGERSLAVARIRRENAGSKRIVEAAKSKLVKQGLFNINTWLMGLIFLLTNISVQGISLFTPTIVRLLFPGRTTVQVQLRTVPPFVVAWVWSLAVAWYSDRIDRRGYVMLGNIVFAIVGYSMFVGTRDPHALYAATFLNAVGVFPQGPFALAWSTNNSAPDTMRATSTAAVVTIGTLGAIVATWSYLPNDAKNYYKIGNSLNVATTSTILVLIIISIFYCKWENKQRDDGKRDHRLDGLAADEIAILGSKHPDFRYSI